MKDTRSDSSSPRSRWKFFKLTPLDWGRICSIAWTPGMRATIGILFSNGGSGCAETVLEGREPRIKQINRIFSKRKLPYRLRMQEVLNWSSEDAETYPETYLGMREVRIERII